jgi:hypothetical protein
MSKVLRALVLSSSLVVLTAGAALAQSYPPSPVNDVQGQGGANAQADAAGTAFTGAPGIDSGTIVAVALLMLGIGALYIGWRRADRLSDPR